MTIWELPQGLKCYKMIVTGLGKLGSSVNVVAVAATPQNGTVGASASFRRA